MDCNTADLTGQTITSYELGEAELALTLADGRRVCYSHFQDCCEHVSIADVAGSLDDLVGVPLLMAEESSNSTEPVPDKYYMGDSYTWTFYRFATVKGYVTIRWIGVSNGYYSESVDMTVEEPS